MRKVAVAVLIGYMMQLGCVSWDAIKPTEVPKAGTMAVGTVASGPHRGRAVAVSVASFEQPDGRLVEVTGKPRVRITTRDRKVYVFKPPISASVKDGVLTIKSVNYPPMSFPLSHIQKAEVGQDNWLATGLLSALGGLALGGIIVLIVFVVV